MAYVGLSLHVHNIVDAVGTERVTTGNQEYFISVPLQKAASLILLNSLSECVDDEVTSVLCITAKYVCT